MNIVFNERVRPKQADHNSSNSKSGTPFVICWGGDTQKPPPSLHTSPPTPYDYEYDDYDDDYDDDYYDYDD